MQSSESIEISFLDHVAIIVEDLDRSVRWYQKVLGLRKYQFPEWGDYPIFMMHNKCGVALFPSNSRNRKKLIQKEGHFAFHVDRFNFERAQGLFTEWNIEFVIQDHHYFESLYIKDPDGHKVELTTIKDSPDSFYKSEV